ncbi:unnamed protein product [Vitrella brassicaformis CCMP3155]|uniref:GST N-terminal domain-containing protein n=1 Tax=Vitrella brassicaformis (strain CCMP3155) TaxID=1169540 RepID=A0A0G4EFM6_VITBC|nr:unnamed protein product [Vitrella brassicaformis CCMP3155]|eukprot:CEL94178.1 unnamed protein product [Vitrella brassicaformis CCMP3155]
MAYLRTAGAASGILIVLLLLAEALVASEGFKATHSSALVRHRTRRQGHGPHRRYHPLAMQQTATATQQRGGVAADGEWTVSKPIPAPVVEDSRIDPRVKGGEKYLHLPRLYVYDHCPFCVRARMIFGLKNIKHDLVYMANDDIETPTHLIGKKMAPILEVRGRRPGEGLIMPESLDIVKYIDESEEIGAGLPLLKPFSGRSDLKEWLDSIAEPSRRLSRPRFAWSANLPEFAFDSARRTYIARHPLENPSSYEENYERSAEWIAALSEGLKKLDGMIANPQEGYISEGGISYDDIDMFPRLRNLSIVKGLEFPPNVKAYIEVLSKKTDVALYTKMAF